MCKEAREYLALMDGMDQSSAREWMQKLALENPFILSEMKGMSIARAVLNSVAEGREPRPPILSYKREEISAWYITKGFLSKIGVASIDAVPTAPALMDLGSRVEAEIIHSPKQLLDYERAFPASDLTMPAARLYIQPPVTSVN